MSLAVVVDRTLTSGGGGGGCGVLHTLIHFNSKIFPIHGMPGSKTMPGGETMPGG